MLHFHNGNPTEMGNEEYSRESADIKVPSLPLCSLENCHQRKLCRFTFTIPHVKPVEN